MKKTVLFALPFVALMLAVACKKQEAAPAVTEQVAGTATEAAAPVAAPAAAPAAAPVAEKKGK
jgi:hypothetical protein